MSREMTSAEWGQLSPDEQAHRTRHKRQAELDKQTVHDVARQSLTVTLDGVVMVQGRGTATPQEIDSALRRFPVLHGILDAIAASKRGSAA